MTEPNTLFPGRPNYTGPTAGYFGLLHHDRLYEESHNVMERVAYVRGEKPAHEIPIRLHNMIYLGVDCGIKCTWFFSSFHSEIVLHDTNCISKYDSLYADYETTQTLLTDDYETKHALSYDDYSVKRDLLRADYETKYASLDAEVKNKRASIIDNYKAKKVILNGEILAYIRHHIPDCAWDGTKLVLPKE